MNARLNDRMATHRRAEKKLALLTSCAAVGALLISATPLQAQVTVAGPPTVEAQEEQARARALPTDTDADIVVTAQRREENLQDIPISISAIGGETLTDRNIASLVDLSVTIPSVNISERRGIGVVTIRGIGFEVLTAGADPGVAVHQDGVYIARPAAALSGFYDVERVEIARGPQGTLYGRNATGGAVNIISRSPTEEFSGFTSLTYGNYDAVTVEGAVSGALIPGKLLARVAFKTSDHDGYGKNFFTGGDINDLNTRAVRATIELRATDDLTFTLRGDHYRQNDRAGVPVHQSNYNPCVTTPPPGGIRRCGSAYGGLDARNDPQNVFYDFEGINSRRYTGLSLSAELDLGDITARSISSYRKTKYRTLYDGDGTSFPIGFIGRAEDGETLSQEFQLIGSSSRFNWLIGVYYFNERNNAQGLANLFIPDANLRLQIVQNGDLSTDAYAIFAQGTYKLTDRLSITLGGRYSHEKKGIENEFAQQLPTVVPPRDPPRSATFSSFTPRIVAELEVVDNVLLYVGAQRGFKSGGFAAGARGPAFAPETIWAYEAGVKSTFFDRRLTLNSSVFHYDYTNLQVGQIAPTGPVVSIVTNAASAVIKGLELEAIARPSPLLTLEGNVSLLDTRYKEFISRNPDNPAANPDLSGNRLAQAPELTFFVAAQLNFPAPRGTFHARAEFAHSSKVFFRAFNEDNVSQNAYDVVNAFLNYETQDGRWEAGLFARNLFNEVYATGAAASIPLIGSPIPVTYGTPRTYGLRVGFNF